MSFIHALRGIWAVLLTERHMRIHLCAAFYVVLAGFVTKITLTEWRSILLCCVLVLALECINTAVEKTCDAVTTEFNPHIRLAKDAAAGGVLLAAAGSAVIGGSIFFTEGRPRLALEFAKEKPAAAVIIVLTLVPCLKFIFRRSKP